MTPTTPHLEELVQRSLDGACTPAEEAELSAALAQSPELARYQASLQALDRGLRGLPELDPPAHLRSDILTVLRGADSARTHAPRPLLRREYTYFLAGVAATLILTLGLSRWRPTVREDDAAGTALPSPARSSQPIRIDGEELGELRWTPSSNGPSLELQWHATTPARLELQLDPGAASTLRVWVGERSTSIPLGSNIGPTP